MAAPKILILDNGAYNIKAGISGVDFEPRVIPNSLFRSKIERKTFIADEIDTCRDFSGLVYRRPHEKGMLVSWDAQKLIWDRVFSKDCMDITPAETSLLLTEPYFNLPNLAEATDQIVFEEYGFESYYRCTPASLIPHGGLFGNDEPIPPACQLLVDVGYSYTHVLPVRDGKILWEHARRIDVGGKLLTNQLKHLVSFRQWNMQDETFVMNQVMERCSYISMDWRGDLEACKRNPQSNPIVQQYVLPDFSDPQSSRAGYIRSGPNAQVPKKPKTGPTPHTKTTRSTFGSSAKAKGKQPQRQQQPLEVEEEQVLWMGNERFAVPELLFSPSDVGFKQAGLAETIAHVIGLLPEEIRGMFWAHIGVFGGLGNIEALGERLERDLRALCPIDYEIGIFEAFDPAAPPYHSALSLTASEDYMTTYPVTKAEYQEFGADICRRRFGGPSAMTALATGVSAAGVELDEDTDDDELDRLYAMGIDIVGNGRKKKIRIEEEEVTTGGQGWGGRRRRGQ